MPFAVATENAGLTPVCTTQDGGATAARAAREWHSLRKLRGHEPLTGALCGRRGLCGFDNECACEDGWGGCCEMKLGKCGNCPSRDDLACSVMVAATVEPVNRIRLRRWMVRSTVPSRREVGVSPGTVQWSSMFAQRKMSKTRRMHVQGALREKIARLHLPGPLGRLSHAWRLSVQWAWHVSRR